jgi:excisionase family DNA binding protein
VTDGPHEKRTEYLTARQLADHLQVSETTIHRLRRRGQIPFVRLTDRIVRFNLKDVRSALNRATSKKGERDNHDEPRDDGAQLGFSDLLPDFEIFKR